MWPQHLTSTALASCCSESMLRPMLAPPPLACGACCTSLSLWHVELSTTQPHLPWSSQRSEVSVDSESTAASMSGACTDQARVPSMTSASVHGMNGPDMMHRVHASNVPQRRYLRQHWLPDSQLNCNHERARDMHFLQCNEPAVPSLQAAPFPLDVLCSQTCHAHCARLHYLYYQVVESS
jgi:hypothetical protein